MDTQSSEERLRLLRELLREVVPSMVDPPSAARLVDDLGVDSIDVLDFRLSIEEHFGIEFEDGVWVGLRSLDDIASALAPYDRKR